jgi:DNA-binding transcriptional LysR family regulator
MRALEDSIGAQLLIRDSRSATPTQAGLVLAKEARAVLEQVSAMTERTRAAARPGRRIRCACAIGDAALTAELTSTFAHQVATTDPAGAASVQAVVANPGTLMGTLHAGGCDVILIRGPFNADGLDSELVRTEPRDVLLPSNHPLAEHERLHISQLHNEPITIWPAMSAIEREHWAGADLDHHSWQPGAINSSATDVMVAVQLGQAIAFIPRSLLPNGHGPLGIIARPVEGLAPSTLHLAWPENSRSPLLARFVQHVINEEHSRVLARGSASGQAGANHDPMAG